MRTSIQKAWPSKPPDTKEDINERNVEPPQELKDISKLELPEASKPFVVSVDSKDLAAQISPIISDKFFLLISILCGTSVFCALICLCMAMSMSSTIKKLAQKI